MPKVHLFDPIGSLHEETQLYTQRRSNAEAPANYRFTVATLVQFVVENFGEFLPGPYAGDAEAAADGVNVGQYYKLSAGNEWGMPYGVPKIREV